jgi:hypothetical protein
LIILINQFCLIMSPKFQTFNPREFKQLLLVKE